MAPSPQALLTSLVANAVCACGSKVESTDARMDENAPVEVGGVEIIVNDSGSHAHAVYPHFDDIPLGSCKANGHCHVAYPAFDCKLGGLIGEHVKGGAMINDVGIEIIANDGSNCCRPYGFSPYFEDQPDEAPNVDHGTHAVYPVFGNHFGGLLGEKPKNDATANDDGAEILARNGMNVHRSHAVYPCFGNKPPDECPGNPHIKYPVLHDDFGGLIGEKAKDDTTVNDHGIEIITNDGINGHHSHAVYPCFGNKPLEEGPEHSHVMYPVPGDNFSGLIGDKPKDDAVIDSNSGGVEVIAGNGLNGQHSHAVYPYSGNRPPDADPKHSPAMYPVIEVGFGGLIGEKLKDDAIISDDGVEIIACRGADSHHFADTQDAHAVYRALEDNFGELLVEKAEDHTMIENFGIKMQRDDTNKHYYPRVDSLGEPDGEDVRGADLSEHDGGSNTSPKKIKDLRLSETAASFSTSSGGTRLGPHPRDVSYSNVPDEEMKMAKLITAFFALPRQQVSHAMRMETEKVVCKLDAPTQTCTGCGAQHEQHDHLSSALTEMSWHTPGIR